VSRAALRPSAAWRERLSAMADQPPAAPRQPLWWESTRIGSVEPQLWELAGLAGSRLLRACVEQGVEGWRIEGELTPALAQIANAMRVSGCCHVWRDEALAVRDEQGRLLGTVERAAVRPLGIATHAVHLAALAPDGMHWLQQRSFDKPNDPGLWDTLVGGMIPASDTVQQALERETWEEAGLRLGQLQDLRHAGQVRIRAPARHVPHGYVEEVLESYLCTLPAGVAPENQDGEVACFRQMAGDEATARMEAGEFAPDACLILLQAFADPE
jgi:8-oxo-dGTP pyrophosphatase MutT (NUDIX family)